MNQTTEKLKRKDTGRQAQWLERRSQEMGLPRFVLRLVGQRGLKFVAEPHVPTRRHD